MFVEGREDINCIGLCGGSMQEGGNAEEDGSVEMGGGV